MQLDLGLAVEGSHLPAITAVARAAEELGFAGLWTSETRHDSFLPLALAAQHTQRIELGTSVAIAFSRSPMVTAQIAWDLQSFSRGRLLLGLGTQVKAHIERRFGMPWDSPVRRLRDYIHALRAIWHSFQTGASLDHRGPYYQHTLLTPFFNPGPIDHPAIPIWIAGVNGGLARLAGETCDGFHIHPFHSPRYIREIVQPAIGEGAATAGRKPRDIALATSVFVITGRSRGEIEHQRERMRQQLAFYASTPSYRVVLDVHGWGDVGERLSRLAAAKRWAEMPALVSDDMLRAYAVAGAPEEIGALVRDRYNGLIDRVALYLPFEPGREESFWRTAINAIRGA